MQGLASSTPLIDGAIARTLVNASWDDTLTITGPFAKGDPVQFLVTAGISGSISSISCTGGADGTISYRVGFNTGGGFNFPIANCSSGLPPAQRSVTLWRDLLLALMAPELYILV